MEYPLIQIVDEEDNFIRNASYEEAVQQDLMRRAARVFVFDEAGNVLIQRRSAKISQPLKLDNSSAGHVDAGETYYEAALRELEEELGVRDVVLVEVERSFKTRRFFNTMYKTTLSAAQAESITIDPDEVAEIMWLQPAEVDRLIVEDAASCTESLVYIWRTFKDKLIQY